MLNAMRSKLGLLAVCLVMAGAYGCGSDDDSKDGKNGGGSADTSSFSVEVRGNSGTSTLNAEQKDAQAGESSWGATISGDMLMLFLVDPDGTTLTARVKTSENAKAPGTFAVGDESDDIQVTVLNPLQGNVFTSIGEGTIQLDNCPRAMGEHIKGSFKDIKLQGELGGNAVETLNGSFDVVVYAKSGDLFCNEPVTNPEPGDNNDGNNDDNNNDDNNSVPMCMADMCENGGTCCPYMECVGTCEFQCFTGVCMTNPGSVECVTCAAACLDSCNVSQECRSAMGALGTCEATHGCDELADDDAAQECLESHCCSELNAAY